MEYARLEISLKHGGWSKGIAIAGAIAGPVEGIWVSTSNWQVLRTVLRRKDVRKTGVRGPNDVLPREVSDSPLPEATLLTIKSPIAGPNGAIGTLSRLWVSRADARITHVLVRTRGGAEQIVPVNLIDAIGSSRVTLKINKDAVRSLFLYRPDAQVEAEVRSAVDMALANPRARRDVKVHVSDGETMLTGEVDTQEQMRQAEQAARAVAGVRGVTNDLVVQESLGGAVESLIAIALGDHPGDASVKAFTEHGIVHLEGCVATPKLRDSLERLALGAPGVKVVVNHLRVTGEPPDRSAGTGPLVRNR